MPYDIRETSRCGESEMGLFKEDEDGSEELIACHTSRSNAQDQIAAIEAGKSMSPKDLLVTPTFGQIKDLDDKGTYGEYLIHFGSKEEHDLEGDFFTKDTAFWLDIANNKSAVLYGHGMDDVFGTKRLDKGGATLKQDDEGVWMETQLQRRNEYEEMVHQLAKRGKLGLSSGTASHLVERERVSEKSGKTIHEIKQWPLGFDATLTPTPAEPRVGKVRPVSEEDHKSIKRVAEDVLGFASKGKPNNVSVLGAEFKARFGTKATEEEIEERYQEFQDMVNMSASEIEEWGEKECSDKASQNPDKVRSRVVSLLRTNKEDWGDEEYDDAGKVISFISRMKGVDGGDKPSEDCPTKRNISLMNWGFNPTKSLMADLDEIKSKFEGLSSKAQHDYSVGDLVAWGGGDAQGRIVETVGPDDTVSPSTTPREFSGNEDEEGYLIELVDYDEEEDEVVGRDETVFHLAGTLSSISESDAKNYTEQTEDNILEDIERGIEDIGRKLQRI